MTHGVFHDVYVPDTSETWHDPDLMPKTWTTHDEITRRHTVEAPRNKVGDIQVYCGDLYTFNGERWVLTK